MRYLHTMLRVRDLDAALDFFCDKLGLVELRRRPDEKGRYTNVFLAAPQDKALVDASKRAGRDAPLLELTYNWDAEDYGEARYFGHLAFEVDDIYALCDRLMKAGVTINRPPRDGVMAFVRSPDKQSIELLQKGAALPPARAVEVDAEHREVVGAAARRRTARRLPRISGNALAGGGNVLARDCRRRRRLLARRGKRLYMSPRPPRPSSSGPGHRPFTAVTRVRFP